MGGHTMLRKSALKDGMKVRHEISGNVAEVHDAKSRTIPTCIMVRRRQPCGRLVYPIWDLTNVRLA